jgi:FkbM family methyltransferase
MVSYAQKREDVLLRRVFPDGAPGFYIDVGAADPVCHSVTKHFYDRGWHGVNVEPSALFFHRLCVARPRDVNLNVGLSDREGELTFHEAPGRPEWSSFAPAMARAHARQGLTSVRKSVRVITLARLCEEHVRGPISFLKIDVEWHEREVVSGGDWERWRPRVVLLEANGHEGWEPLLLGAAYLFAQDDGTNRYYVRAEDRSLLPALSAPVSAHDDYLPHAYVAALRRLTAMLPPDDEFGPQTLNAALAVGRALHALSRRFPRLAAAAKRLVPRADGSAGERGATPPAPGPGSHGPYGALP